MPLPAHLGRSRPAAASKGMGSPRYSALLLIGACVLLALSAFAARPFDIHHRALSSTRELQSSGKTPAALEEENRNLRILLEEAQESIIHLKSTNQQDGGGGGGAAAAAPGGPFAPPPAACPKPIPTLRTRGELPDILQAEGKRSGVELGVQGGYFSRWILDKWQACTEYHLVDLWETQKNYIDLANCNQDCQDWYLSEAHKSTAPYKDKVQFYRNYTTAAATYFQEDSVDFVYVDARHDYKGVAADLEAWWPKLKKGGIFAGHDYVDADEVKYHDGPGGGQDWSVNGDGTSSGTKAVRAAVDEFGMRVGRQVVVTYNDKVMNNFWNTWYMRK